ncbi:DUF805 domain-containing protein [Pseudomonas sp. NPDC007930]|uniref:DUF805 domain-containing protein n=1 Tax=Pseudomonas sp. NPDC007930 TaxID=3364417 RepID=UPI0036EBFD37
MAAQLCSTCNTLLAENGRPCSRCKPSPYLPPMAECAVPTAHFYPQLWRDIFNFRGRLRRKHYWLGVLYNLLLLLAVNFVVGFIFALFKLGDPAPLCLLLAVPFWAIGVSMAVRRVHDVGRRWYWVLVPVVGFVFCLMAGHAGSNLFGPAPKAPAGR